MLRMLAAKRASTLKYYDSEEWKIRCLEEAPDQYAFTPTFKKLASFNIFIYDSQSGNTRRGKDYVIKERSYIMAFAPKKYVSSLVEHINLNTDHLAFRVGISIGREFNRITVTKTKIKGKWKSDTRATTLVPKDVFHNTYKERFGSKKNMTKFDMFHVIDPIYSRKGKLYRDVLKVAKRARA
jgi:hypothetical protein